MINIKWQDGAVCYAGGKQHFPNGVLLIDEDGNVVTIGWAIGCTDLQLNEPRIGHFLEKSELNTKQKYSDAVEVLRQFGFKPDKYVFKELSPANEAFRIDEDLEFIGTSIRTVINKSCRKITYKQLMAIGKLKRMIDELGKPKPELNVDNPKLNLIGMVNHDNEPLKDGKKYVKTLYGLCGTPVQTDVYRVLDAFKPGSSEIEHAIKKLLNAGQRGHKDELTDLYNAIESIEARITLIKQKEIKNDQSN